MSVEAQPSPPQALLAAEGDWLRRFRIALAADRAFYLVVAAMLAAALALGAVFGRRYVQQLAPSYLSVWLNLAAFFVAAVLSLSICRRLASQRSERPFAVVADVLRSGFPPERAAGLALFAALGLFMSSFIAIKCMLPLIQPFWADALLARASRALLLGQDGWRWLHPLLGHPAVTRLIEIAYIPGWMVMMSGMTLYFCAFSRDGKLRRTFLTAFLSAWVVNGLVVACLFMSAGPAFYGDVTGDTERYRGLVEYLAREAANPLSAHVQQGWLLEVLHSHTAEVGGGISAFPSLHVSMASLALVGAWRVNRHVGAAVAAFALVIAVGSIHLAWHYALDSLYAVASVAVMWKLASRQAAKLAART
jgi:hypothetical protein